MSSSLVLLGKTEQNCFCAILIKTKKADNIMSIFYIIYRLTPKLAENELDKVDKVKIRRSCIPSKNDPPEEMIEWLKTYTVCVYILALILNV